MSNHDTNTNTTNRYERTHDLFTSIPAALYWRCLPPSSIHTNYFLSQSRYPLATTNHLKQYGICNPCSPSAFHTNLSTFLSRIAISFSTELPYIISTSSSSSSSVNNNTRGGMTSLRMNNGVSCLDIDSTENRFLLSGFWNATISVYDLSPLGSDYHTNPTTIPSENGTNSNHTTTSSMISSRRRRLKNTFHPIASSLQIIPSFSTNNNNNNTIDTPLGHASSITQTLWYPNDSGIFFSSDTSGKLLLWDTNRFQPVTHVQFPGLSIQCMDIPKQQQQQQRGGSSGSGSGTCAGMSSSTNHSLIAVGCCKSSSPTTTATTTTTFSRYNYQNYNQLLSDDRVIYLYDYTSGSTTHRLVGHTGYGGINTVHWSPTHEYLLASGGNDGVIHLWDVRKSGSGACLYTLDRYAQESDILNNKNTVTNSSTQIGRGTKRMKKSYNEECNTNTSTPETCSKAPNDYSHIESNSIHTQSHNGPISKVLFTPDGKYLVSAGCCELCIWDIYNPQPDQIQYHRTVTTNNNNNYNPMVDSSRCSPSGIRSSNHTKNSTISISNIQGILRPTSFIGPSNLAPYPIQTNQRKVPMIITQPGNESTTTVWIGHDSYKNSPNDTNNKNKDLNNNMITCTNNSSTKPIPLLLGYELHGRGGKPIKILNGHLDDIHAITYQENDMRLFTGGADGMILCWGKQTN